MTYLTKESTGDILPRVRKNGKSPMVWEDLFMETADLIFGRRYAAPRRDVLRQDLSARPRIEAGKKPGIRFGSLPDVDRDVRFRFNLYHR